MIMSTREMLFSEGRNENAIAHYKQLKFSLTTLTFVSPEPCSVELQQYEDAIISFDKAP